MNRSIILIFSFITPFIISSLFFKNKETASNIVPIEEALESLTLMCDLVSDSLALVALYDATDGANWANTWDLGLPFNSWYGVTVNGDGCVTCLDLDGALTCDGGWGPVGNNNNLSGTIPPELGNLSELLVLSLTNNQLTGTIPAELGNLSNLTELHFSRNSLSGELPAELGNLTSLQNFTAWQNELTGEIPPELGDLVNLNVINISNNQLSGEIPVEFGELLNLTNLNLGTNELTGNIPPELGTLTSLINLLLDNNELSGNIPSNLANLTNLEILSLGANELSGIIPSELGNLSSLTKLSLFNNQLNGSIPLELGNLMNLRELILYNNALTGNIPLELGNLSDLISLQLSGNELTGNIPIELGNLTNLEVLILFSNNLTGSIPSELGNLTNLTLFDLSDNILIGSIPSELGNLTNLTRFGLLKNLLSGNIPSELGNLTNLTTLWLYDNNLTGNIPPELGLLTNLTKFYLHNNELEGCFPDEINIFCSLGFNVIPSGDGYNLTNNPALPFQGDMEQWCNGTPQIGATCDDGNAATTNDVITATCGCEGVVPPCDPVSDSLALVALYNSTGGANWTNTWDLSQPMNTWFGVEVNSFGCVTCLDLDGNADCIFGGGGGNNGNNLNGILPDEIGNLVALEKLLISFNNQLVGEIPSTIVNLTSLKELYLALNSLTGSLPTSLGQISTLEKINIQSNQLTGNIPISIGDLSNLNFLALFNNQLSGELPSEIGNLQNLVRVNLGNNLLTGSIPTSIGNLSNLEALSLYANQLSGVIPTEIGNLSNLQELILMFNNLNGNIPSELGNLTNLTRIYIYNNELQGCFPIELNQFCSLGPNTNSNVDGYGFNNNPALPFQGDMEQWCNGTPQIGAPCDDGNAATVDDVITATCGCEGVVPPCDPVSDSLALVALYNSTDGANWTVTWDLNQPMSTWFGVEMNSFGCVTCLDLDGNVDCGNSLPTIGNNLVGGLPAELANLSQLEKLYLSENNISGNIPTAFGGLLNLERLDLANNNISGSIPDEIGALSNLVYLRLSTNNLSGSIPTSLGNLTGLFSLFLQENQLTGSIPTAFGNFQNLVSLNLSVNNLSGEIPQEILTINSLTQLWLVNNNFTGELPDVFSNNNSLITFHLGVNQFSGVLPISLSQVSSLTELKLFNNGFTGCFPNEYNVFCSIDYDFSNNPNLPDSGDFDAFCLNGTGSFIGNEINDILCSGESVIANGVTYDEATPTGTETIIGGAANGCDSVITVNLTFTNGASTGFADAGMDMSLCDNLATVMLTGSLPTNTTGQWTTTSGATIVNPNNANTDIADLQIGANEFFWSLSTVQCSNYDTDTVIVFYDIAEPDASDDTYTVFIEEPFNEDVIANDVLDNVSNWEANLLSTPAEGTLTFNLDGTFSYLPPNDYCGQVTFDYELCNLNCPGLCDIAKATINVIPETDTNLDAPNVITPNGDKFNEYLIIPKLFNDPSGFPNNKFVVFNQWGNVVFEMEDYQNDWNGVNKNGKELPQATYFYYFDDGQGDKVKGKVVILKE